MCMLVRTMMRGFFLSHCGDQRYGSTLGFALLLSSVSGSVEVRGLAGLRLDMWLRVGEGAREYSLEK